MSTFVTALDPDAPALFAVAWAGESQSDNRFDTAREYTERWHHQMQIREGVGARVSSEPDALWRLFFNALPVGEAPQAFAVEGPQELVAPLFHARAVMV